SLTSTPISSWTVKYIDQPFRSHSLSSSIIVTFVCIAANPCIPSFGPCLIALLRFGSYCLTLPLESGNRLLRCLSPIHTNPCLLACAWVRLINSSILRYFLKKSLRNLSASSGVIPRLSDIPYLLAPYSDCSRTTFISLRTCVSLPSAFL